MKLLYVHNQMKYSKQANDKNFILVNMSVVMKLWLLMSMVEKFKTKL